MHLEIDPEKSQPLDGGRLRISGRYSEGGFGVGLRAERVSPEKGFLPDQAKTKLVKEIKGKGGETVWSRSLESPWISLDQKSVKGDAITFTQTVPADQPTVMNLGPLMKHTYTNDHVIRTTSTRVHLTGTNINAISYVDVYKPRQE